MWRREADSSARDTWITVALFGVAALLGASVATLGVIGPLLLIGILAFGLSMRNWQICAMLLVLAFPLSSARFMPSVSGLNLQNVLIAMSVLSYGLHRMFGPKQDYRLLDRNLLLFYLAVYGFASVVGMQYANRIPRADLQGIGLMMTPAFFMTDVVKTLFVIIVAVFVAAGVRESENKHRWLWLIFAATLVPPLMIFTRIAVTGVGLNELVRLRSFFSELGSHANQFAVLLNSGFALALFTAASCKGWTRWIMVGAALVLAAALALTFSRGGYVGFVVIVLGFIAFYRQWKPLLGLVFAMAIGMVLLPDAVIDRVTLGITHGNSEELSSGRLENIWKPLWPTVFDSPFLGHGLLFAGWSGLIGSLTQAHNAYLDLLLDVGVVGAGLVLFFYFSVLRDFVQQARQETDPMFQGFFRGAFAGLLALLAQAMTDDRLFPNFPQLYFWMTYGVLLGRLGRMTKSRAAASGLRSRNLQSAQ